MLCRQCGQTVSILRVGLLSSVCPECCSHPAPATQYRVSRLYRRIYLITVMTLAISLAVTIPFFPIPFSRRDFSPREWLTGTHETRGRMARNLVESRFLMGKSKDIVLSTLGEPDMAKFGRQTLRYVVDEGRRSILHCYRNDLVIRFDKFHKAFDVSLEPHQSNSNLLLRSASLPSKQPGRRGFSSDTHLHRGDQGTRSE